MWNQDGSCNYLFFNLTVDWGEPDIYINRGDSFDQLHRTISNNYDSNLFPLRDENFGGGKILLCPSNPLWGYTKIPFYLITIRPYTYIIGIAAYTDNTAGTGAGTQFKIHVTSKSKFLHLIHLFFSDIPSQRTISTNCTGPSDLVSTHK